jgi:replicative DNA helicase
MTTTYQQRSKPEPTLKAPHNEAAEQRLLGSVLMEGALRDKCNLAAQDFYHLHHQHIWQAVQAVDAVSVVTVFDWLDRHDRLNKIPGGEMYLYELQDTVPTALQYAHYANQVKAYAQRRRMLEMCQQVAQMCHDEDLPQDKLLSDSERAFVKASTGLVKAGTRHISEVLPAYVERVEAAHAGTPIKTMATGFADIDKMLNGGARAGELFVIAARPGMGKTSLLLSIISNNVKTPATARRGVFYTLEMTSEEQIGRMVSLTSGIDGMRLSNGDLRDDEWAAFMRVIGNLESAPIYLNEEPMSIEGIKADARRMHGVHTLDYLMIDFLGLVDAPGDRDYERATAVALGAKMIAKELGVPVFLACQLSRSVETRNDKRPVLSDLRDSGRIEEAADVAMFIYRDEVYNADTEFQNIAEILIRKNRRGPVGNAMLFFDKRLTGFKNLAKERIQL